MKYLDLFLCNELSLEISECKCAAYTVRFDFESKTFKANNELCIGNFIINGYFIFITDNVIVFTQDHFGWGGITQNAEGIYFACQNKLVCKKETHKIQNTFNVFQNFCLKYRDIFSNYIKNTTQKEIWLVHQAKVYGHDLLDEIFRWDELSEKINNKIKVIKTGFFFSYEEMKRIFNVCEMLNSEEDLFVNICTQNHMLYKARSMPHIFTNKLIRNAFSHLHPLDSVDVVGVFVQENKGRRDCINSYDFYTKLIDYLICRNFKVKIFGYVQLRGGTHNHEHIINSNQQLCEILMVKYKMYSSIEFYNSIFIEQFIQHASTLTYYITNAGSMQHLAHLFSFNLKKALVWGAVDVPYFIKTQELMGYTELPRDFIEYIDSKINNNTITDVTTLNEINHFFKVKNLNNINQFLESFFT